MHHFSGCYVSKVRSYTWKEDMGAGKQRTSLSQKKETPRMMVKGSKYDSNAGGWGWGWDVAAQSFFLFLFSFPLPLILLIPPPTSTPAITTLLSVSMNPFSLTPLPPASCIAVILLSSYESVSISKVQ
ncbi:hypothetical protein HJG60_010514 [Phyllostomus discolor]|uniref:Uncharacterized protein n=1 Tax=Phyllostomus discolor TaxID=89673 RepID=A0A834AHH6_9CHIR|nr:hypothetical protein HJG60_010514 [Phyllostomus discolor]